MEKNGEISIRAVCKKAFTQCSDFLHGACSPTVSFSLNDVCCSGNALMWEIVVVCSMWQIIRHANQAEAAVESLIMVRVPTKAPLHPTQTPPESPLQTPPSSTPILLLPLYPQTDRWTRGWSTEWREEFGKDWVVQLVVALGVEWLYVDLGGGLQLIFGFHWSVSLSIVGVLVQLKINRWRVGTLCPLCFAEYWLACFAMSLNAEL